LQTKGTSTPLFLFPQVLLFETLAAELGDEQPVYALELLEEDLTACGPSPSFERLAQLYCNIIREVRPQGPYRLGGWCMWGWVAYEVARRLEQGGQEVELVLVMDAWAPGYWKDQTLRRKLSLFLAQRGLRLRWMVSRLWRSDMKKRKADVKRRLGNATVSAISFFTRKPRPRSVVQEVLAQAARGYQGAPIRADVLVFKGDHQPAGKLFGEDMGWVRVVRRAVHTSTLPGNHAEIFDLPGAKIIAYQFRKFASSALGTSVY
jgi:thioesterase domain-containing protein